MLLICGLISGLPLTGENAVIQHRLVHKAVPSQDTKFHGVLELSVLRRVLSMNKRWPTQLKSTEARVCNLISNQTHTPGARYAYTPTRK